MRWHIWSMLVVVSLVLPGSIRADESAPAGEEPIYQGKTLAEWIADLKDPKLEIQRAAAQALGKFGLKAKEALPELHAAYKRLSAGPPALKGDKKYSETYLKLFADARRAVAEALILIDDHPGPELAPILLEALKTGDADKRRDIVIQLGKLGPAAAKTTVPALIGALQDTEDAEGQSSSGGPMPARVYFWDSSISREKAVEIRLEAVKSLGRIGPAAKPALHALTMALKLAAPAKEQARVQQMEVMPGGSGAKGRTFSFTILTGDKAMLLACAEALGRIRPEAKGTISALRLALRDLDEGVRWAALCALLESGQALKEVVPILSNFLRDKDAALRRVAVEALGKSRGEAKQIVPLLLRALKDSEAKVRAAAAEALRKMGVASEEVIQALTAALGDADLAVVQEAGTALAKFGAEAKPAVPRLLVLLNDSNAEQRGLTCFVFASIGPPAKEAKTALEKIAKDDSTEYVRLAAYTALARIETSRRKDAISRLIAALKRDVEKDQDIMQVAAVSLILIGRENREVLPSLQKLRDETSSHEMRELIDVVREAIQHPEKDIFDSNAFRIEPVGAVTASPPNGFKSAPVRMPSGR